MKKNELTQIKGLNARVLKEKAKSLKKEIADLVVDKNMKKLKDLKSISKKKKDLAQVLTVIRQKEQLSVLSGQLSDKGLPVISQSVTEKQKTDNKKAGGKL